MPNPPASKAKTTGSKPTSSSSVSTRSTSRAGAAAPGPLAAPQSPGDSALPAKEPLNAHAAKDFLCRAGLLPSKTETATAALCSNILSSIASRPDSTQTVCALIRCVNLILPEAFAIISSTNTQLTAISDKIDVLLSNSEKEPAAPSPPMFAELGDKLDKVTQDIQKATETWQTVPSRPHARSPPPAATPRDPPAIAPMGPTCAEISRNKRVQSQGCYILVEPSSAKDSFDSLSARALAQKAELAWNAAWDAIKDTDTAKELELTAKPRIVFKAALRLARGGIRYEMGDRTQAALLSDARIATEFEKGFGGASCKGQGATILLQCAPVYFEPEDPAAIGRFEGENGLKKGDVLSMTWCKPPHKRKPDQTMAVLKLEMRSHDLADRLITEGGQLDYAPVLFRKARQEPTRCLRCQTYGHKAASCKNGSGDVCSRCGETHRIANCTNLDRKWCVPCQLGAHCSFDRDCPTFRTECDKFNKRRPENGSMLFGPPRPYDPKHRPIFYPIPTIEEIFPDGDYTALAANQNRCIRELTSRRPNWTNRERIRKEPGLGEAWEGPNVLTAPLMTGSNAIPIRSPRATGPSPLPIRTSTPVSRLLDSPTRIPTPPPRAYSPSQPSLVTPPPAADILCTPTTPRYERTSESPFLYDLSSPDSDLEYTLRPISRPRASTIATSTFAQ